VNSVALGLADTKVAVADMTAQERRFHIQRDGIARRFRQVNRSGGTQRGQSFKDFWARQGKLRAAKEQCAGTDCSPRARQAAKDRMWRR